MARLFFITLLAIPLCHAGLWLLDNPGMLNVVWLGYEIRIQIAVFIFLLLGVFSLLILLLYIITSVVLAPKRMRLSRQLTRQNKGIVALADAFTALAIGDNSQAKKAIMQAEKLLDHAPATQIVAAQLARNNHNTAQALPYYEELKSHPNTRFLGLRGLTEYALEKQDYASAFEHVKQAFALNPSNEWAAQLFIDLHIRYRRFGDILPVITKALRKKSITKHQAERYKAISYYLWGVQRQAHDTVQAISHYKKSLTLAPDFIPAAIHYSKLLATESKLAPNFTRHISAIWQHAAHPKIGEIILNHYTELSPSKFRKTIEKIISKNPQHIESLMIDAQSAINVGMWDSARNNLKSALTLGESARICLMMADIEKQENNDEKESKRWLQRAITAPQDASWVCDMCGCNHHEWLPHCQQCNSFDSILWQAPRSQIVTTTQNTAS